MILAQTQHRKVSMLPTERSMLPVIITSVRPKAMMPRIGLLPEDAEEVGGEMKDMPADPLVMVRMISKRRM